MTRVIWWIRRDLRLADNEVLAEALKHGEEVIPLFILDPVFENSRNASAKRFTFLFRGLHRLDNELRRIGSRLIIRQGNPLTVLSEITAESAISAIFAEADFSTYARKRDAFVAKFLPLKLVGSTCLRHPEAVGKGDGSPYTIYTPYMKAWKKLRLPVRSDLIPTPNHIITPEDITSEALPECKSDLYECFDKSGETEANHRLVMFTEEMKARIFYYADQRNRMDLDGTSQLSPYLRFGMLSARRVVVAALEAVQLAPDSDSEKGAETWLNELIWREFYISILYHFPEVARQSFRPDLRDIRWRNDQGEFSAWKNGVTGYPLIDAGMRQLAATGWMHNRARMITASFLVKDLMVDWRLGEAFFMSQLVDGDPAANNGGWQWTAGTGTDAAPYFRIFNPVLQGQKFDPQGVYIRRWVPELQSVPIIYIHQPWQMPLSIQAKVGVKIGDDYPRPIVDHTERRHLALAMYGHS